MLLKTCIIDDEMLAVSSLQVDLDRHCPEVAVVAIFNNPLDALAYTKWEEIDLLFLDIEMPRMNGIEFLENLGFFGFDVIFTTAYQEYALQAIKLKATDYLLKPIASDDLVAAVAGLVKVKSMLPASPIKKSSRIALPDSTGIELIELETILYCLADKNYTTFYMISGDKKVVSKNLGEFEKVLDSSQFIRIHQSSIVNINFVKKITKGENPSVIMKDDRELSVSRSKKNEFMELLKSLL